MSDDNTSAVPSSPTNRRASFVTDKLSGLFGRSAGNNGNMGTASVFPGPIVTAAASAQAQQHRRMSVSSLGLSGSSPTQPLAFGIRARQSSTSTNASESPDSAIEDGDSAPSTAGTSPFGRRMSFGARAMRDLRGGGSGNMNGEGFNWSDQLRSRAQRSASISSPTGLDFPPATADQARQTSVATQQPTAKEAPKPRMVPDHFQERILKGDFYMD